MRKHKAENYIRWKARGHCLMTGVGKGALGIGMPNIQFEIVCITAVETLPPSPCTRWLSSDVFYTHRDFMWVGLCGNWRQGYMSRTWFLNLGTNDIWGWIILCCGGYPMHCRKLSSIPGLYPLGANSTLPSCDNKKCLQVLPNAPMGQNHPIWEPLV